jgi:hypothetical protein
MAYCCNNSILAIGDSTDIDAFLDRVMPKTGGECRADEVDWLDRVVPAPFGLTGRQAKIWKDDNWGCSESSHPSHFRHSPVDLQINLLTTDTPPLKWVQGVSRQFPTLRMYIAYHEDDQGFYGVSSFMGGRLVPSQQNELRFAVVLMEQYDPDTNQ